MNSNAVDSFTISTEGFDGPLLPEGARVVGSPEFQSAVSRFFESQFLEMRVNGLCERINREIKRRTRVAGLFPNESSVLRLLTAILVETSDEWETGRAYFSDPSQP
jgi:hypothetical protein